MAASATSAARRRFSRQSESASSAGRAGDADLEYLYKNVPLGTKVYLF